MARLSRFIHFVFLVMAMVIATFITVHARAGLIEPCMKGFRIWKLSVGCKKEPAPADCQTVVHGLGAITHGNEKTCDVGAERASVAPSDLGAMVDPSAPLAQSATEKTPVVFNSSVDDSTAWDWAESRSKPVIAMAECSTGDGVARSIIITYASASVDGKPNDEIRDHLRTACAEHVRAQTDPDGKTDPAKAAKDLASLVTIAPVPKEIFERMPIPVATGTLAPHDWGDGGDHTELALVVTKEDRALLARALNDAGSCSPVAAVKDGKTLRSNCETSGLIDPGKKLAEFRKTRKWRIFGSTLLGALSGIIRGGCLYMPGTTITRVTAALVFGMIRTAVNGKDVSARATAIDSSRAFLGMLMFGNHDFLDGGAKKGIADAVKVGAFEGAKSFAITCGLQCAKPGALMGVVYIVTRKLADSSREIAGIEYTRVAEAVGGGLMGYAQGKKLADQREKELETLEQRKAAYDAQSRHLINITAADPSLSVCFKH